MTDSLPTPLVPAEADLRGYDFMPFYGAWLRASDFNASCTDAEYRAAVNLWWSSWHQTPPASLPNNDATLCMLADLGRNTRRWRKVKKVAMGGFVMCSDGRFYHEFLSVQANIQWEIRKFAIERGVRSGAARRMKSGKRPENFQANQAPEVKAFRNDLESLSKPSPNAFEIVSNKGSEVKGSEEKAPAFVRPDWVDADAWNGYVAMRKKIKKPATDYALKLVVDELARLKALGHDPREVLEHSIKNSYQDVYAPKGKSAVVDPFAGNML